jgi:SfnB family sulfur acquisition oxidoreductase
MAKNHDPQDYRPIAGVRIIRDDTEALDVVRKLASVFSEGAAERDRSAILPRTEIERLTEEGFYGISVPRRFGGAEVTAKTVAEAFRLLGAADPSLAQIPQNHFAWISVLTRGTDEQQSFFFRRILAGERIGNAHSENTRNRPGQYTHTLVREAGGWRFTGTKYYSTGALFAHWIPFVSPDDTGALKMFFADARADGVSVIDDWRGMGQRTTASGTTVFDRVFVPENAVFPFSGTEGKESHSFLHFAQLIHTAIDVGIAENVISDARSYIQEYGRPWTGNPFNEHANEPFVVGEFGKLALKVRTAAAMLERAAAKLDGACLDPIPERTLAARLAIADARVVAAEVAVSVASDFFALTGARATLPQFSLDRHWRNARTHTLHDPLRWKYFHLGNYDLNRVEPDSTSYI